VSGLPPNCRRALVGRPDTSGQPVIPLYARDAALREEICENCERSLYDLLAARRRAPEPKPVTAQTRVHGKRTALEFDHVPPVGPDGAQEHWLALGPASQGLVVGRGARADPAAVGIPAVAPLTLQAKAPAVRRRARRIP